jgi:flagellar biosynthesis protein FlhA
MFLLAIIPGFPTLSFLTLGGGFFWLGRLADTHLRDASLAAAENASEGSESTEADSISSLMKVDILSIEVGHALVDLIDPSQDGEILERVQSIRKQFAQDLGIVVPKVQLRDNLELDPTQYAILLKGSRIATGRLMVDFFLAMDPGDVGTPVEGEPTTDPVYGLPALWVHKRDRDEAVFRGYTVVNCATVVATHLTRVLKESSSELLTRQDVQELVDRIKATDPRVIEEVLHSDRLSLGDLVKVLQNLLAEDVSVRDLLTIFETLADHCRQNKNPEILAEFCRKSLGRSIVQRYLNDRDELVVLSLDRLIEDQLQGGLVITEAGSSYLKMDASIAQSILQRILNGMQGIDEEAPQPILLISARLRKAFRNLISGYIPQLVVLSFDEVPAETKVRTYKLIS